MPTVSRPHPPHFTRVSVAPISIQDRDLAILEHVYRHRFLRSTHLYRLIGGSEDKLRKRLQRLFHERYLDRPGAQLNYYRPGGGSQHMVYALGTPGAEELQRRLHLEKNQLDWISGKNRTVKENYLEHTLAVADVMVGIELAVRGTKNI